MQTTLDSYKAFTLALLIKKARRNGMKYKNETEHKFYKSLRLHLNYSTFHGHWENLIKNGCVKSEGQHQQLVSSEKCAELLNITSLEKKHLNKLLRERDISLMKFTEAVNWLLEVSFIFNFRAQYHKLKPQKYLINVAHYLLNGQKYSDKSPKAGIKKLAKEAAKKGMDTSSYALCLLRDNDAYIKTGSYHLSEKFGISQRKANRLLNDMVRKGIIKREHVKVIHDLPVNNGSFDFLKSHLNGKLFIPTRRSGFIQPLGSKVTLPEVNGVPTMFFTDITNDPSQLNPIAIYKPILTRIKYGNGTESYRRKEKK